MVTEVNEGPSPVMCVTPSSIEGFQPEILV